VRPKSLRIIVTERVCFTGLNPLSQHFSQISVSDLILVNEDGQVVEGDEPINAAAFAIHSEIHKARPDVDAACHAHSVYGKAFSVFGRELDMMTQDSLRFWKSHAVYDNFGGVVLDREEGKRIAKALGNGKAVILQNHGLLTVGKTVCPSLPPCFSPRRENIC
jgi:ribulose-5-phosphate 4-epimerase/fuculose-1-phosphate aldolase